MNKQAVRDHFKSLSVTEVQALQSYHSEMADILEVDYDKAEELEFSCYTLAAINSRLQEHATYWAIATHILDPKA